MIRYLVKYALELQLFYLSYLNFVKKRSKLKNVLPKESILKITHVNLLKKKKKTQANIQFTKAFLFS